MSVTTGYGLDKAGTHVASAVTSNLTAATAVQYTWTTRMRRLILSVTPTATAPVFYKINSTTCVQSTSDYTGFMMPGDSQWLPDGPGYDSIALVCANALTKGTDFNVVGVD